MVRFPSSTIFFFFGECKEKIRTRLDLLSIPQSGGKNVKTFRWDHGLQIQNLFMEFKRVPLCCLKKNRNAPRPSEHPPNFLLRCVRVWGMLNPKWRRTCPTETLGNISFCSFLEQLSRKLDGRCTTVKIC